MSYQNNLKSLKYNTVASLLSLGSAATEKNVKSKFDEKNEEISKDNINI